MDIKTRINKLNMMAKILVAPVLVIALLVLFGLASYVGLATQKGALNDIYNNRFKNYQVSARSRERAHRCAYEHLPAPELGDRPLSTAPRSTSSARNSWKRLRRLSKRSKKPQSQAPVRLRKRRSMRI